MTIIRFIGEVVFFTICGWVGHVVVKALTFGRVGLARSESSESIITESIGAGVLLGLAILVSLVVENR